MALCLLYEFEAALNPDAARATLTALQSAAHDIGFDDVTPLRHLDDNADEATHDHDWLRAAGTVTRHAPTDDEPTRMARVAPLHVIEFSATCRGAEPMSVGLAAHPGTPGHYRWKAACKTHGAAAPSLGGPANFLRAHRAAVAMLDRARAAGLQLRVSDDGEFWTHRDPKRLLDRLEEWNRLLQAMKGPRRAAAQRRCVLAEDVLPTLKRRR